MDQFKTPAKVVAASELQASSARIRRQLRSVSWGVPLALLLLIVSIGAAFYQLRAVPLAMAKAEASQREAAERMGSKLDVFASQVERVVLTLRDWTQDGVVNVDHPLALNAVLIPVLRERGIVSSIHVANDEGREILLLKSPEGWKNRITHVPRKGKQQNWLVWEDARRRISEEWKEQDYDPRKRPWFTGALSAPENKVFWTAPYMFQTTQEPGITAALRWTDKATGRQWVVALDVLLSDLSRVSLELPYATQGQVALLTADGKVLGLPRNAGFQSEEKIKKAVLQAPDAIGLKVLAQALSMDGEALASALGARVAFAGEVWRVKMLPQPLRNQEFRLALMAPEQDFAPWPRQLILAMAGALLLLMVTCFAIARRMYTQVAEPVSLLFDQLAAGNETLAAQGGEAVTLAELSTALQKAQSLSELGDVLLTVLARHISVGRGSLYLADESRQRLMLCSGFACPAEHDLAHEIAYGEGLAGQCAIDRNVVLMDRPPVGYLPVTTSLGTAQAHAILIQPILHNNALVGILELALLQPYRAEQQSLLENLLPTVAMSLEILERSADTQRLLQETRQLALTLQENETRLQEGEEQMRRLLDLSPVGCTIIKLPSGKSAFVNRRLAFLLGYSVEEMQLLSVADYWPDAAEREVFDAELRAHRRVERCRAHFRRVDGNLVPLMLSASFEHVFGSRHLVNWGYDITALDEAEEALRRAKEVAEEATKDKVRESAFGAASDVPTALHNADNDVSLADGAIETEATHAGGAGVTGLIGTDKSMQASVQNAAPAVATSVPGLPALPGIDVKAGMATTMDNAKLYTRLLIKFCDSQGDFANLFAVARTHADPAAAARAAHTLKGTAGNIGAKGVQAAAADLEHACLAHAGPEELDKLLGLTLDALAPVIAALQPVGADLPAIAAASAPKGDAASNPAVQQALQRLTALLKDSDADAGDAIDELMELAKGTPMATQLKRVAAAVADFDFDAALAALR